MDINNSYTTITIWGPRKLFDIKKEPSYPKSFGTTATDENILTAV